MPLVLIAHPSVPAESLAELTRYLKERQPTFAYATTGSGTSNHLSMEVFKRLAGVNITHVPYKGGAQVMSDVIGGQVQSALIALLLALPQINTGKVKGLAITGERRAPLLANVPTFAESGFPAFPPGQWCGLFVPAGTPAAIVERIHASYERAVRAPDVQARFQALGAETVMNSPAAFTEFLRVEHSRIGRLVRENNIVAD